MGGIETDPSTKLYRQAAPPLFQFFQGFTETHLPHNAPTLWQEGRASQSENPVTERRNRTQRKRAQEGKEKLATGGTLKCINIPRGWRRRWCRPMP